MKRFALVALVAACSPEPTEPFPINPGGSGVGSSFTPDAPAPSDDGSTMINGRVCKLVVNPQSLATCEATGAGGLTVVLGAAMAATADDGAFTMMRPAITTGLVWRVSGTGIQPAAMRFTTTSPTLPAIDTVTYLDMLQSTDATLGAGSGAVMTRITRMGFAVPGATVTSQPAPDSDQVFYDGPTELEWQTIATMTYGVAWMPSIAPGNATLTVTSGTAMTALVPQPVFADTITFVLAEIP